MRRKKIMGSLVILVILLSFVIAAKFAFFQQSETVLRSKIALIERRVLTETEFGREMADFVEAQNTTYVLQEDLSTEGHYLVAEDQILYKPFPLEVQKESLLWGKPVELMRNFHEEIRRAQQVLSKWEPFLQFFRDHGEIQPMGGFPTGELDFHFKGDPRVLVAFARRTLGLPLGTQEALDSALTDYISRYNKAAVRTTILRELQASLSCDAPSPEALYTLLVGQEGPRRPEMSRDTFWELFVKIYQLYGYYEGDHRKVARFIGNIESLSDFSAEMDTLLAGADGEELARKTEAFGEKKIRFQREVAQIVRTYF